MPTVYVKADTKDASRSIKKLDDDVEKFARSSSQSLARMEKSFKTLKTLGLGLGGFFSAQVLAGYTKELIAVSDTYSNIKSRIDLVTDSTEDFTKVYDGLYQLSRETNTTLESNTQAFVAMSNALKDASDQDIIGWLNTLDQGLVVSGSGAEEAANFMRQFNQAMAGGIVRAEEFNSMMENNPYIMNKVAESMGKTVGQLRAMMLEGELTSEVFTEALSKISDVVEDDFGNMALTVERAWNDLRQVWNRIISDSNEAGGGTNALAESIAELAQTAEENRDEITEFLAGMVDNIPVAIEGIKNISVEMANFGSSVNDLVSKVDSIGGPGWKEIGLIGLILVGAKGLPGPLKAAAAAGLIANKAATDAGHGIQTFNDETSKSRGLVAELIRSFTDFAGITVPTEKLKEVDEELKDFFENLENTEIGIDLMLEQNFADIDAAALKESAQEAGEEVGKALGEGISKEAKKEMEKLQKNLGKDLEDIGEQLFDLNLEIKTEGGSPTGAWDAVIAKAAEYEEAAKKAAQAGSWEEARTNLEKMVETINKLEGVEGAAPTDQEVARQKQMVQYWLDMTNAQTSFHSKRQYLQNAQKEQDKLNQMLKEQKEGAREIISEDEARLKKIEELQEAQQILLDIQRESSQVEGGTVEATIDSSQVEAAKTQLNEAKTATEDVNEALGETGTEVVKLGNQWTNLTQDVINDLGLQDQVLRSNIQTVRTYVQELKNASSEINNTSYRTSTGSETITNYATGGPVMPQFAPTILPSPRYASGGVVQPQAKITYANTPRFATGGGLIPGYGGTDSVMARVTPGEGVVTPLGMQLLTRAGLSQLNVGRNPFESNQQQNHYLDFSFGGQSAGGLSGDRVSIDSIIEGFAKLKRNMS